jgi:serine/threonine protein kinase
MLVGGLHAPGPTGPLAGRVLSDRYRIVRKLGEGGGGSRTGSGVYLADHLLAQRQVALAVLLPQESRADRIQRFLEDARTVARIGHENVVDVLYGGRAPDGLVFLAMELLHGATLHAVLGGSGPMAWARARNILLQTTSALEALHHHGILHRDLTPRSLFLTDRNGRPDVVKVLNVGIAGVLSAGPDSDLDTGTGTGSGDVPATPEYISPELAQAHSIDHRADIYSLGCVIYQMVTGEVPFTAASTVELMAKHLQEQPVPPRRRRPDLDIPAEVDAIVLRALEKDPERRWSSMADLGQALDRGTSSGRRTTTRSDAQPARRQEQSPPAGPRRWRRTIVIAAALAGLILGAVGLSVLTRGSGRIHLTLVPPDSTVLLDGVKMGEGSPLVLETPPGRYVIMVARKGYLPSQHSIQVKSHQAISLPVTLLVSPD